MEPPFPNLRSVSQERRQSQLGVPQPYLAQEHNAEPGDVRLGMDLFVLEQITSALRLPISSIVTVEEQPGQFRARIAMAVPPSTSTAVPETKEFSGDLVPTKYGAVENAVASAIDFMKVEKGVRIDDSSQDLISKITAKVEKGVRFEDPSVYPATSPILP